MSVNASSSAAVLVLASEDADAALINKALVTTRAWEWSLFPHADPATASERLGDDPFDFVLYVVGPREQNAAEHVGRLGPSLAGRALMLIAPKDAIAPITSAAGEYIDETLASENATPELVGRLARACVERKRFAIAALHADGETARLKAQYDKLLRSLGHDVKTAVCVIRLTLDDLSRHLRDKPELLEIVKEVRQETEVIVKAVDEARSIASGNKSEPSVRAS